MFNLTCHTVTTRPIMRASVKAQDHLQVVPAKRGVLVVRRHLRYLQIGLGL